jgi:peptidoglycan/xylan/chitin deacetylase (PgdA/CDA1 family)
MVEEGHAIQNHTYNHRNLDKLSEKEITQEIFRTAAVVRSITGAGTRFIRPPGGNEGRAFDRVVKKFHLTTALWSVNCSKVEGTRREELRDYVVSQAEPGAIVLMHNLEPVTLAALPEIVETLRGRGYTFVTLSESARRAKK